MRAGTNIEGQRHEGANSDSDDREVGEELDDVQEGENDEIEEEAAAKVFKKPVSVARPSGMKRQAAAKDADVEKKNDDEKIAKESRTAFLCSC